MALQTDALQACRELLAGARQAALLARRLAPRALASLGAKALVCLACLGASIGAIDALGAADADLFILPASVVEEAQESALSLADDDPRRGDPVFAALFPSFEPISSQSAFLALSAGEARGIENGARAALELDETRGLKPTALSDRKRARAQSALRSFLAAQAPGAERFGLRDALAAAGSSQPWAPWVSRRADRLADENPPLAAQSQRTLGVALPLFIAPGAALIALLGIGAAALWRSGARALRALGRDAARRGGPRQT